MSASDRRQRRCAHAIEDVLRFLRKKGDTRTTMVELNDHFLSPAGILESNPHELMKSSLTESEAQLLALIPGLTRYTLRSSFGPHPQLDRLSIASEYLKTLFVGLPVEQFYLLCLDDGGRLIQCPLLQSGTIDATSFYLGHLLQAVVVTGAKAIVLSHNHPGGTLRPSSADIACTIAAMKALLPLRIPVLDHIVIADNQAISMRYNGLINIHHWISQDPTNPLVVNWLDIDE